MLRVQRVNKYRVRPILRLAFLSLPLQACFCSRRSGYESSTAGVIPILPSSTKCCSYGWSSFSRIYLCTWVRLSPASSTTFCMLFVPLDLCPTWVQVKSCRFPCCLIASNFILYTLARSLGRMFSRCRLLSVITMVAVFRSMFRTITGIVFSPAISQACFRLCPAIIS